MTKANQDAATVAAFGAEWARFDQQEVATAESRGLFAQYFSIFPWSELPPDGGICADIGCGSGRWALHVAPKVAKLHMIDASTEALAVARNNLKGATNVQYHAASAADLPLPDNSLDWAYSLGVLHHLPDTENAILAISRKLKPAAHLLLYLYYAFDNRPRWYRALWRVSDVLRRGISRLPRPVKFTVADLVALLVYWPLARCGRAASRRGRKITHWPLAYYAERSFYIMRNDALDRLGTPLEHRFTRAQIEGMLVACGFGDIAFSDSAPFWCVVARAHRATSSVT